jgi:hypothetical protein
MFRLTPSRVLTPKSLEEVWYVGREKILARVGDDETGNLPAWPKLDIDHTSRRGVLDGIV